jgi:hypothetical protein
MARKIRLSRTWRCLPGKGFLCCVEFGLRHLIVTLDVDFGAGAQ